MAEQKQTQRAFEICIFNADNHTSIPNSSLIQKQHSLHLTHATMALLERTTNNRCWRGVEPRALLVGTVNGCSCWGKQAGGALTKSETELPCDLAIPLPGTYPKKTETLAQNHVCTSTFTTVAATRAEAWKQPKGPLMEERRKHNGALLSHKKEQNLNTNGSRGHYAKAK